jgi:lactate dehydrogenase-like 2-hydroxyacid dehydrogenase
MTADILMIRPMLPSVIEALDKTFRVHRLWEADDEDAFLAEIGDKIRGIATGVGVSGALMRRLPNLEIIGSFGVGYDNVDVATAKERGIRVTNTPDVLNDAVAEITLALMLALCRRIVVADRYVREGRWPKEGAHPLTGELTGQTVGILGLGRIGKEIARRCQVFKMQVVYHGRSEQRFEPFSYYADLTEMASAVDWLVVIAPGGAETKGIVSREVMEALGPDGCLVNMARGSLVDETALVELLQSGKLGGAALDVFENEPETPEALWTMDNVVLQPHQGSATNKTRWAMGDLVVRNLEAHFAGKPALTPVV